MHPDLPLEVGFMRTPMIGNALPAGRLWAADTGCFAAPDKHDDDRYLAWLRKHAHAASRCLFATAPDVVGDGVATLSRAVPMLSRVCAEGYPAALVAQDGMEHLSIPWQEFDVLFIGGTTAWKLGEGARQLVDQARFHGKFVHMGRVNSLKRLRYADQIGCHSADGTFLAFGPDKNIPRLRRWLNAMNQQPTLFRSCDAPETHSKGPPAHQTPAPSAASRSTPRTDQGRHEPEEQP